MYLQAAQADPLAWQYPELQAWRQQGWAGMMGMPERSSAAEAAMIASGSGVAEGP